ncbi:MAG: hypothetical protein ACJATI_003431 [Halioglobus sp.]
MDALAIVSIGLLFTGCGSDEPEDMMEENPDITMGFSINSDKYDTPNVYLIFHSVVQYDFETMMDVNKIKNQFSLAFTDGNIIVSEGDIVYSTITNHVSYHHFRDTDDTVV